MIRLLDLKPHPEGGYYRETFRDSRTVEGGRAASTAILFLLQMGQNSRWHRIDAAETWHWYAGTPLLLRVYNGQSTTEFRLGDDLAAGQSPQETVPAHAWQSARSLGGWTLCGCTVAPGFEFRGFEVWPDPWGPR